MSSQGASSLIIESTASARTYERVETAHAIAAAMQHITTTHSEQVALVAISLDFDQAERAAALSSVARVDRCIAYLLEYLRPLVRKTDAVFLLKHHLYFVLLGANQQGGQIVQSRLWDASLWRIHSIASAEIQRPRALSIGHSVYPTLYAEFIECIQAATEASLTIEWQPERSSRRTAIRQPRAVQVSQGLDTDELPARARRLGVPYLSLLPRRPPEHVQHLVNAKLAQELHCYPLGRERNMLTVAMSDPQDRSVLDRLHQETGLRIFPVLTHPQELQTALDQLI
ncbi:MAG: hypothetical protein ABI456_18695 [Ktedonobacteraceae bacterium]|nr:hypothetical protein [Chloroflexota bacterium]